MLSSLEERLIVAVMLHYDKVCFFLLQRAVHCLCFLNIVHTVFCLSVFSYREDICRAKDKCDTLGNVSLLLFPAVIRAHNLRAWQQGTLLETLVFCVLDHLTCHHLVEVCKNNGMVPVEIKLTVSSTKSVHLSHCLLRQKVC